MVKNFFLFIIATLFVTQFVSAKDYTVVVRGHQTSTTGKTEVTSHGDGTADTLTITPSTGATTVVVTVEDAEGNLLDIQSANTNMTATLSIAMPDNGATLRIRDDQEVVYEEEN